MASGHAISSAPLASLRRTGPVTAAAGDSAVTAQGRSQPRTGTVQLQPSVSGGLSLSLSLSLDASLSLSLSLSSDSPDQLQAPHQP